jgi:hypothetical protein
MFRTIKKNIIAPLLPKIDDVAKELGGDKAAVPEANLPDTKGPDRTSQIPSSSEPPSPQHQMPAKAVGVKEEELPGAVQANAKGISKPVTAEVPPSADKNAKDINKPVTTEVPPSADKNAKDISKPVIAEVLPSADKNAKDISIPKAVPAVTAKTYVKKGTKSKKYLIKGKEINMANINASLEELMKIDGTIGVAVVDSESGMALGTSGGGGLNLELAAAGNSEVVKAKMNVRDLLGLKDDIDDILITLTSQYHLIRPLSKSKKIFIYLVLNRKQANLAMARIKLASVEGSLEI